MERSEAGRDAGGDEEAAKRRRTQKNWEHTKARRAAKKAQAELEKAAAAVVQPRLARGVGPQAVLAKVLEAGKELAKEEAREAAREAEDAQLLEQLKDKILTEMRSARGRFVEECNKARGYDNFIFEQQFRHAMESETKVKECKTVQELCRLDTMEGLRLREWYRVINVMDKVRGQGDIAQKEGPSFQNALWNQPWTGPASREPIWRRQEGTGRALSDRFRSLRPR